jgi:hypothetical protein
MAEFRRPLHNRIAGLLERMDAQFLTEAECYFGGGTQLAMSHGEYRESRDVDFLVSSPGGLRKLRETVTDRSLGKLFRRRVFFEREVRTERDAIRTFIKESESAPPIKFEIVVEARIDLKGALDRTLGVPTLALPCAIAEKLLANADRGRAKEHRARDVIDLAFVCLRAGEKDFATAFRLAEVPYGRVVLRELDEVLKMLRLDAKFRAQCVADLLIEDAAALRKGLERLNRLKRLAEP